MLSPSALLAVLCLSVSVASSAGAATGYYSLDNAALSVKQPSRVPLVAITRVGQGLVAAGLHGVIILSNDSGVTWQQAAVPVDVTLTDLYFSSPDEGWAVGHYGVILHTSDAGRNWSLSASGLDVISAVVATAAQAAPDNGAAGAQRVAKAYSAAGPSKPFLAVGPCGPGILAAGQQNMAMFSSDKGKTWQNWGPHVVNPRFRNIYAVVPAEGSTFLFGEGGLVIKADASCTSFTVMPSPSGATLFGGLVSGAADVLVYGLDGAAFHSTTGGADWKKLDTAPDAVITSGLALDRDRLLVATLGGNFYLTNQADSAFEKLPTSIPFEIAGVAMAPDGNLIAIGTGGVRIVPSRQIEAAGGGHGN